MADIEWRWVLVGIVLIFLLALLFFLVFHQPLVDFLILPTATPLTKG